jgi:predicted acetyltransferase
MSVEFRQPTEDNQDEIRRLAVLAFNVPRSWVEHGPPLRVDQCLCAFDGDRLVATSRDIPMVQWFGGRPLRSAGISGVATLPERRGTGIGDDLIRALLQRARDRGAVVTSLFPATVPFYRRLGYEYAGTWTVYESRLTDLPRAPRDAGVEVEEFRDDDLDAVRECYRRFAEEKTGLVEGEDADWWWNRIFVRWMKDVETRTVVVRGADGVEGYASFSLESRGQWKGFDLDCTHLVAVTGRAWRMLLGSLRRYRGVGHGIAWQGPPADPVGLVLEEESARIQKQFRYMSRLLDVESALRERGYPQEVSGEVVLSIEDPLFEDNHGPFRLIVESGKASVERVDDAGAVLPIGALSSLFSGYVSPRDLASVGAIEAPDASLDALSTLFAGPAPWLLDHF